MQANGWEFDLCTQISLGLPLGVDRSFVYDITTIEEYLSPYFEDNLVTYLNKTFSEIPYRNDFFFTISNMKAVVNGFYWNNSPYPPTMYK